MYQITKGNKEHYLYQHFRTIHNRQVIGMKFWGLEKFKRHWRGSNLIRRLSQRESWWVYELGSLAPRGLNKEFDLNSFLANY